jgi:ferredoxin--NADP+ reductase
LSTIQAETVLSVRHWTDTLFSFRTTRDPGFRFLNGQFTMVGLEVDGRPLLRAYSMASANYETELEFFSIKVANGPLTSRLQHLEPGHSVLVGRKPTGTLIQDNLTPGKRLYLFATGTGLAPFLSIVKDPDIYDRFERVILVHGCRTVDELAYSEMLTKELPQDEFVGEMVAKQLSYYPSVTRESFRNTGRITELLSTGRLARDLDVPPLNPADDRVMLCGGPAMLSELVSVLEEGGFAEGNHSTPGQFVIEKAFVEK